VSEEPFSLAIAAARRTGSPTGCYLYLAFNVAMWHFGDNTCPRLRSVVERQDAFVFVEIVDGMVRS
jgi:hypothetical protein